MTNDLKEQYDNYHTALKAVKALANDVNQFVKDADKKDINITELFNRSEELSVRCHELRVAVANKHTEDGFINGAELTLISLLWEITDTLAEKRNKLCY